MKDKQTNSKLGGVGWATLEGGNRAVLATVGKVLGEAARSAAWCTLLAVVYGLLQGIQGLIVLRRKGESLRPTDRTACVLYLIFAVGAVVNTTLGVYVYALPGADIAVSTFLRTFSIVFAAPFAWMLFGERLHRHQMAGVLVFLAAGWLFVGMPSLAALQDLPLWMWLSLVIAVFAAVNEVATSAISARHEKRGVRPEIGRALYNFWIGTLTFSLALPVFLVLLNSATVLNNGMALVALLIMASGIVVQLNWRYFAYVGDGTFVVIKKFFTLSVYFLLATVLGIIFHAEPVTIQKVAGVPLAIMAFLLIYKKAFHWACRTVQLGRVRA